MDIPEDLRYSPEHEWVRADGSHERLREGGGVLGGFEEQNFGLGTVDLAAGDRLVLFTDGVTEVCNPEGEEFGDQRLLSLLAEHRGLPADALRERIAAASALDAGRSAPSAQM